MIQQGAPSAPFNPLSPQHLRLHKPAGERSEANRRGTGSPQVIAVITKCSGKIEMQPTRAVIGGKTG